MICLLCSVGHLNKQIATLLDVSVRVVELEKHRIAKAIGIPTAELIIWAVENRPALWAGIETNTEVPEAVKLKVAPRSGSTDDWVI